MELQYVIRPVQSEPIIYLVAINNTLTFLELTIIDYFYNINHEALKIKCLFMKTNC